MTIDIRPDTSPAELCRAEPILLKCLAAPLVRGDPEKMALVREQLVKLWSAKQHQQAKLR